MSTPRGTTAVRASPPRLRALRVPAGGTHKKRTSHPASAGRRVGRLEGRFAGKSALPGIGIDLRSSSADALRSECAHPQPRPGIAPSDITERRVGGVKSAAIVRTERTLPARGRHRTSCTVCGHRNLDGGANMWPAVASTQPAISGEGAFARIATQPAVRATSLRPPRGHVLGWLRFVQAMT